MDRHHDESLGEKMKRFFFGEDAALSRDDEYYRAHHARRATGDTNAFDDVRPAYRFGHHAGLDDRFAGRSFDEVEPDLRTQWDGARGEHVRHDWDTVRPYARDAYARGQEQRVVLNEERLAVGTREVQAGEVTLRKGVESEVVRERVDLAHDEVTIERRAISPADVTLTGDAATIGEGETIRVPLMAEEAVVEKRVVPTEEVVLRTQSVVEEEVIEDTVRRETLETTGVDETTGRGIRARDREVPLDGRTRADDDTLGNADRASRRLETTRDRIDDLRT